MNRKILVCLLTAAPLSIASFVEAQQVKKLLAYDKEVNEGFAKTCHLTPNLMFSPQQN